MNDVTGMLAALEQGGLQAAESLLDVVYSDLRRLAASKMTREAPGQTIQPTALAHDAWLRLLGAKYPHFENRAHFFSAAAEVMRRILIDRARRRQARRHGGGCERVNIDECDMSAPEPDDQLLAVHDALDKLARKHPRQAEVVKLRYFAGMTNEETAAALEVSVATVKNDWTFARAWIFQEIGRC